MHVLQNDRGSNVRLGDLREFGAKEGLPLTQKTTSNRVTVGHREECPKALLSFALDMSSSRACV